MIDLSKYSPDSKKYFLVFLLFVIVFLLSVIGYMGMQALDLEKQQITDVEAQTILDTLPNNPDANGLTPKDKAKILDELQSAE